MDVFYPVIHGIHIVSSLAFISNLFTRKNSSNLSIVIPQIYVVVKDNIKVTIDRSLSWGFILYFLSIIFLLKLSTIDYVYLSHVIDKYSGLSDVFFFQAG